jgi:outer membrane protein TolC
LAALLLAGCALYHPRPLPEGPDLRHAVPALRIIPGALRLPGLRPHRFDPTAPLDMTDVAILAAINNPQLKAARRRAGVARAQIFQARLLPDPQLSLNPDFTTNRAPGLTDAWSIGLAYDLKTLITRGSRVGAARSAARQVDLDLLWKEWRVVQQARTLFIRSVEQEVQLKLLRRFQTLYANRYARSSRALKQGHLTLDVVGTDLTALLDANTRVNDLQRKSSETRQALNLLLGLASDAPLRLDPTIDLPAPTGAAIRGALRALPERRPDLLALRAGYRSREARVRQAILAQFPALSVGVTRSGDNTGVHSTGLGITLTLPIFNGNRGQITIERATRAHLRQAYQARLDDAYAKVHLLWTRDSLLEAQLRSVETNLPALESMASRAHRAYEARDIGALVYLNLENTLLNKQLEAVTLRESLWETRVALQTLLGTSWASTASPMVATGG